MLDYSKGKVYKLYSLQDMDTIYLGSTTQSLCARLNGHKKDFLKFQKGKGHFRTSFLIFEKGNVKIELVENCSCSSKEELFKHEGFWIKELKCVNKSFSGKTNEQWFQDMLINPNFLEIYHKNPEMNKIQYQKAKEKNPDINKIQYQKAKEKNPDINKNKYKRAKEKNPDINKNKYKRAKEKNPDINKEKNGKSRHQRRKELNPDHNKIRYRRRRELDPDMNKNQGRRRKELHPEDAEKTTCDCGSIVRRDGLKAHAKTKKHQTWLSKQNDAK